MIRHWASCLVGLALGVASPGMALSMVALSPINQPVPAAFRDRAEAMVRKLRPHDAEDAVKNLKTTTSIAPDGAWLIVRVEAACRGDLCMTILARVADGGLVPEFVLMAGPWFYGADVPQSFAMSEAWPLAFPGSNGSSVVALLQEGGQWAFTACGDCFPWPGTDNVPHTDRAPRGDLSEKPPSVPPPMSFEEFRQQIDRPPASQQSP